MEYQPIDLHAKLSLIADKWSPRVVAEVNDYQVKLAKIEGEFVWHRHEDTDELFLVLSGELTILLRDGEVTLREGEMFVVPRGIEHCPRTAKECHILLLEPRGVRNTGDAGGAMTAENDVWI
ncbi:MAG: cupin domain-containing protein [Bacteroidota bacterium]|nr:cupin domain-containing protein [Bacteroidota bacterium]